MHGQKRLHQVKGGLSNWSPVIACISGIAHLQPRGLVAVHLARTAEGAHGARVGAHISEAENPP